MTRRRFRQLAVVDDHYSRQFLGLVALKAIGGLLRQSIRASVGLSTHEGGGNSTPLPVAETVPAAEEVS